MSLRFRDFPSPVTSDRLKTSILGCSRDPYSPGSSSFMRKGWFGNCSLDLLPKNENRYWKPFYKSELPRLFSMDNEIFA